MNINRGSILVGLLWCVALLSLMVVGTLYTSRLDLRVVKNHGDAIQAHYLALAGIEKAKALLYQDALERRRAEIHHQGELYDAPHHFRDVALGRGEFRVFRQGTIHEGSGIIYGITDEESRLNVNHASPDELRKLDRIDPEAVTAITGYRERVNLFRTTRELLIVRGVPPELLLGEDVNQDGFLDLEEGENRDGLLDAGWSGMLTVHSEARNLNASGNARVNLQEADENELSAIPGITADLAAAIVEHRNQNRFESLADLLDVRRVSRENQPGPRESGRAEAAAVPQFVPTRPPQATSPGAQTGSPPSAPRGQPLISEDLLMDIADQVTTNSERNQPGAVNINTAGANVLACLPGMDANLAQAIISYRQSNGFFENAAWLLRVPGMNRQIFKQVAPRVSTRSETFRIFSEGIVPSSGARRRVEVIVRLRGHDFETVHYRESP
jgi:competence ComEA-like helix-hairpin-helix protein